MRECLCAQRDVKKKAPATHYAKGRGVSLTERCTGLPEGRGLPRTWTFPPRFLEGAAPCEHRRFHPVSWRARLPANTDASIPRTGGRGSLRTRTLPYRELEGAALCEHGRGHPVSWRARLSAYTGASIPFPGGRGSLRTRTLPYRELEGA